MTPRVFDNALWAGARPRLSVLTPFKDDDPSLLLRALAREAETVPGVEVILLDDGSDDPALAARVEALAGALPFPARLIRLAGNEGRAKGRNRLVAHARAASLLFLDSDMLPDRTDFLACWLDQVAAADPAVAFGGFSLAQIRPRPDQALHGAMARHADCHSAAQRRLAPEKHLFASNLLVRRDVFRAEAFDEDFTGWGWEDVEWGMRVARRWSILHLDNPATHLGLDAAPAIAAKFEQSAANFARAVAAHRDVAQTYPGYRLARLLKRAPLLALWRPLLKAYALTEGAPLRTRALAMRLYRAALYAEAV